MSELNVNVYARTKQKGLQPPQIAKIKSMKKDAGYNNQYYIELDHNLLPDYNLYVYEEDVEKVRPRIIDLIEVGDYVNGCKIIELVTNIDGKVLYLETDEFDNVYACGQINIYEKDIKSIVTHEQFENISYKVGE